MGTCTLDVGSIRKSGLVNLKSSCPVNWPSFFLCPIYYKDVLYLVNGASSIPTMNELTACVKKNGSLIPFSLDSLYVLYINPCNTIHTISLDITNK